VTGKELAKIRKAAGLSQTRLAELSGVGRHAISYWANRATVSPTAYAIIAIARVLNLPDIGGVKRARTTWGIRMRALVEAQNLAAKRQMEWLLEQAVLEAANRRVQCNAKTRKGSPCLCQSEPGKQRCKFHGGLSTGPRTQAGRERIAEAQRKRWAKKHHQLS